MKGNMCKEKERERASSDLPMAINTQGRLSRENEMAWEQ